MLTAESALALFSMLAISSISLLVAQRIRIPHTVFLVGIGILLAVFATFPYLHFLNDFTLTPELLFFIFLPTLIFESAYNINIKHLTRDALIISLLAIVSLLVSALVIGFGIDIVFTFIGLDIPFILALLFGAIISATDPVAVLALFKEYGAPRRLSLIFEGESIFNDGTGVALFLVILAIAESGVYSSSDILHGTLSFIGMVIGGVIFGLLFGGIFAKIIGWTRSNEFASITLTLVLAHTTFICAEIFSHTVKIGDTHILISSIIATATASLLMGNYGRFKMPGHASEFVEKYWSHFAFLANSLIFIMIGMLVVKLPASTPELLIPILITILLVAVARAISVYPLVGLFNTFTKKENHIPKSWQHVLAWGSLRGALAVTMVLMIPDDLSFANWSLAFTPKELVLALTVSCVFATLFIKATTIGGMMRKLKLSTFTPLEEINYREMLIYIYQTSLQRLDDAQGKGYINTNTYTSLLMTHQKRLRTALDDLRKHSKDQEILTKVIHLHAIGIERKYIKELFVAGEVPEYIIKRVLAKLEYQSSAIEHDNFKITKHAHGQDTDVFEYLASLLRTIFRKPPAPHTIATQQYLYYRALSIISRKVHKELIRLNTSFGDDFEMLHIAVMDIIMLYDSYRDGSDKKLYGITKSYPEHIAKLDISLAHRALYKRESMMLESLKEREMITSKVSISLHERFARENMV